MFSAQDDGEAVDLRTSDRLSDLDRDAIRRLRAEDGFTISELCSLFGTPLRTMERVCSGSSSCSSSSSLSADFSAAASRMTICDSSATSGIL